jgi:sugar/nucleoside kinase (ribokinase family)
LFVFSTPKVRPFHELSNIFEKIICMKLRILGIGNALVDVMTKLDDDSILQKFSLPKGSMQLVDDQKSQTVKDNTRDLERVMASGGSAANTINGLAMLGMNTGFIGSIGNDELGYFFDNDMKHAGIATMLIKRMSVTGTAVALVSPDSERTFATHLGAAVELDADDLVPEQFEGYDILYLEGYLIINRALVEKACSLAKEKNMKVALDLASYNVVEANSEAFRAVIDKYVDILFANEDEARAFTGMEPELALQEISKNCETTVIKVGGEGSWIKRGEEIIKIEARESKVKDTTGAGDLYASGFLYGYANGDDLETSGLYGSVLAGNVIEIVGARMDSSKWNSAIAELSEIKNAAH